MSVWRVLDGLKKSVLGKVMHRVASLRFVEPLARRAKNALLAVRFWSVKRQAAHRRHDEQQTAVLAEFEARLRMRKPV